MQWSKQPLARRIQIAFVLMTTLVSGLFSLSMVAMVYFIEEHLVSQELDRELESVLVEDIGHGRPPRLDARTWFFSSVHEEYPIPPHFRDLKPGFAEVLHDGNAYYVFTRIVDGDHYLLVEDQNEFEQREKALFTAVLAGFLLSIAGAWALGRLTARRAMAPVSRLASQVLDREQLHPAAPALAADYADDEIGQLAAAFDSTLGKIRQSLERERLFTSDVSHELCTPLMIIATSCELLAEAALGERERQQVERIARAAAEMRELVQTFIQLARDDSTQAGFARDRSLATVATEEARRWQEAMAAKGLDFRLIVEEADDGLYNGSFLRCVITNLLRNALHYTDHGHVHLVLEQGGFRIEDSGIGIAADERQQIFEPFVRGSRVRGEGLGLGLSLVKRICTRQGWKISVHSLPAGGSCFRVTLDNGH